MSPQRDPRYLKWIRTLPCLVCGSVWRIEAAHTGPHGMAQKSPDRSCIPLCARHHRSGKDSYHRLGPKAFEEKHGLNLRGIADDLTSKPRICIHDNVFIACCRGERYVLGPVHIGLRSAVRKAVSFWCEQAGNRNFGLQASTDPKRTQTYQAAQG